MKGMQRMRSFDWVRVLMVSGLGVAMTPGGAAGASARDADPGATALERAYGFDAGEAGGPRDAAAAAALYREAAAAGDAQANLRLGYLYEIGDGVDQDYTLARTCYQAAVDAGLDAARMRLAMCHLEGWGGPMDRAAFAREMTLAAESGYVPAQRTLAGMFFTGIGVAEDRAAGLAWLERAAAADDPDAQTSLGRTLERAHGRKLTTAADRQLARTWYQLSAEQDYNQGMRAMARSLLKDDPSGRDWQTARQWLELATENGDREAPYILAVVALTHPAAAGEAGVASAWLQTAAERGNERAVDVLEIAATGLPLADAVRAVLRTPFEERYVQMVARRLTDQDNAATAQPQVLRVVKPVYPASLRLEGTEGQATIRFVVNTKGQVEAPAVVQTSHPLFGDRAVAALREWRFQPGRREGRLVNCVMQVPVIFRIDGEQMNGVDGMLAWAADEAMRRGPAVAADATDLRLAKPLLGLPRLGFSAESPRPDKFRVLLLLVVDDRGRPLREHILQADPEWVGPLAVAAAHDSLFMPQIVDGQRTGGHLILPVFGRSRAPAPSSD